MNHYGHIAMRHWQRHRIREYEAMSRAEQTAFFTNLGTLIQSQVTDLARLLTERGPVREDYLSEVARLQTARKTAQEVVMRQLVYEADTDLTLAEARTEWADTSPSWENLIDWAERHQMNQDRPSWDEIEEMAQMWALPTAFIEQMTESANPRMFFRNNETIVAEATTLRFLREIS